MRHAIVRYGVVGILGILVLTSLASAATKTFVLKNGTRITGEVISEAEEGYVVKTRLGKVSVARYSVEEVIDVVVPEEEFATKLAALADDDLAGHLELGRWAMSNGLQDEALQQCNFVLTAEPDNGAAEMLKKQIESVLAAEARRAEEKAQAQAQADAQTQQQATSPDGGGIDPDSLITMKDIYRIRLAESKSTYQDRRAVRRMRVDFKNKVLERLASIWEGREDFDSRAFLRSWSDGEQLRYVDGRVDREDWAVRDEIEIESEVLFMQEFHEFVFPLLRRSIASVPAHASKEMHGGFRLLISPSSVPTDEITLRVNYSNFVLLDTFETDDGRRMIDRDRPAESLLLQFGLPSDTAMYKHSAVGGQPIKPLFKGKDDPSYQRMLAWIRILRGPVHPIYNISYKPLIASERQPDPEPATDEPEEADEPEEIDEADDSGEPLDVPASETSDESTDEP